MKRMTRTRLMWDFAKLGSGSEGLRTQVAYTLAGDYCLLLRRVVTTLEDGNAKMILSFASYSDTSSLELAKANLHRLICEAGSGIDRFVYGRVVFGAMDLRVYFSRIQSENFTATAMKKFVAFMELLGVRQGLIFPEVTQTTFVFVPIGIDPGSPEMRWVPLGERLSHDYYPDWAKA